LTSQYLFLNQTKLDDYLKTRTLFSTNFKGRKIKVTNSESAFILLVDDIVRTKRVPSSDCARISLSTTIQTGYEWHENLEAVIDLSTSNLKLEVKANNKKIN
tara:strand:- start:317 stop:622 length:306 start_codon:yes stop_codon:yes gene_type:complete